MTAAFIIRNVVIALVRGLGVAIVGALLVRWSPAITHTTRSQAVGACIASLVLFGSGILLGQRLRFGKANRLASAKTGAPRPRQPHLVILSSCAAAALFAAGLLGIPVFRDLVLGSRTTHDAMATAYLATLILVVPAIVLMELGAFLGLRMRPRWGLGAVLGLFVIVSFQLLGATIAAHATHDAALADTIVALSWLLAFPIAGAVVVRVIGRLGLSELFVTAALYGYALYFVLGFVGGPLFAKLTIPEQQILVAASLVPTLGAWALLSVGGSVGFLVFGGGRIDFRLGYEMTLALRYLGLSMKKEGLVRATAMLFPFLVKTVFSWCRHWMGDLLRRDRRRAHAEDQGIEATLFFSVASVGLGVLALIVVLSVMDGFAADTRNKLLGAHAHISITKKGDDFVEYAELEQRLTRVDGVVSAAAFVLGEVIVSSDTTLSGALLKGIDPENEKATDDLKKSVQAGSLSHLLAPGNIPRSPTHVRFLPNNASSTRARDLGDPLGLESDMPLGHPPSARRGSGVGGPIVSGELPLDVASRVLPGVAIGRDMARTLRVRVGDAVSLISPASEDLGPTGPQPKVRRFRVAAVFSSGMAEIDAKFAYVSMKESQRLLGMRNKATGIELRVADVDHTPRVVAEVQRRVGGFPFSVRDWREMNKSLFAALALEKLAMAIVLTFIVAVASFLIVSTLVMIVLEKVKEIAILKSMGAPDTSIMKIFIIQGLIVGIGGSLLGLLGGLSTCFLIDWIGVAIDNEALSVPQLPVLVNPIDVAVIVGSSILITYLASIVPALAAAEIEPVEGLRDG